MPEPTQQSTETAPENNAPAPTEAEIRQQAIERVEAMTAEPEGQTTAPPATEDKPPESGLDAKKLALQIARMEKQLRDQKAASDKTREEYENLVNGLKDPEKRYELLENQFGTTYQDWTERLISGQKPQRDARDIELDQIRQTVQALQSQLEEKKQDEQKQAQAASSAQAEQNAVKYLDDNKDKFPLLHINPRGAAVLISEATKRYNEGTFTSDEELAAELEAATLDGFKSEIEKLKSVPAFVKLLHDAGFASSTRNVSEIEPTQRETVPGSTNQTLTNDLSGEPSSGFNYKTATMDEIKARGRKIAEQKAAEQARREQLNQ